MGDGAARLAQPSVAELLTDARRRINELEFANVEAMRRLTRHDQALGMVTAEERDKILPPSEVSFD